MLTMFSSCGIIRIDTSVLKEQFTDFSGANLQEDKEDNTTEQGYHGSCPCYDPPIETRPYEKIPVCGINGNTYRNGFEARKAGIYCYTRGKCQ